MYCTPKLLFCECDCRDEGRLLAEKFGKNDAAVILIQCEVDFEESLISSGKEWVYF